MDKELSALERALRRADRLEPLAVRAAIVRGILDQLKADEVQDEAVSKLLEYDDPRIRRVGRLLKEGVPEMLANWIVMQENQPAAPVVGNGGVGLSPDVTQLIVHFIEQLQANNQRLAGLEELGAKRKKDMEEFEARLREYNDPVAFLQRLAQVKEELQKMDNVCPKSLPAPAEPDAVRGPEIPGTPSTGLALPPADSRQPGGAGESQTG